MVTIPQSIPGARWEVARAKWDGYLSEEKSVATLKSQSHLLPRSRLPKYWIRFLLIWVAAPYCLINIIASSLLHDRLTMCQKSMVTPPSTGLVEIKSIFVCISKTDSWTSGCHLYAWVKVLTSTLFKTVWTASTSCFISKIIVGNINDLSVEVLYHALFVTSTPRTRTLFSVSTVCYSFF